mgnify:CR=1 FL=1
MNLMKSLIKAILKGVGIDVTRLTREEDKTNALGYEIAQAMQAMNRRDRSDLIRFFAGFAAFNESGVEPQRQVLRDVFAAAWAGSDPFFVDCGAGRPTHLSNTWTLQTHLGCSGLLIEPNPPFASDLRSRITSNVRLEQVAAGTKGVVEFLTLDELSCAMDNMRTDWAQPVRDTAVNQRQTILIKRVP